MATLTTLLQELNDAKATLKLLLADNNSQCCCEVLKKQRSILGSLDAIVSLSDIEYIVANVSAGLCQHCNNVCAARMALIDLQSRIFDQINEDYGLTNISNPFRIVT